MRTRRRILQGLAAFLSACTGSGETIWFNDTGTSAPGGTTPGPTTTDWPTPYSTGATGWTLLEFAQYPQLEENGGYIHITLEGVRLIVLAGKEPDTWVAMDRICTHQGCAIVLSFGQIACPCHGSLWDDRGVRLAGPAQNQDVYPTYPAPNGVWVQVLPS